MKPSEHHFISFGISHWKTPLDQRSQFSMDENALEILHQKAKTIGVVSFFVLTTCNRSQCFSYMKDSQLEELKAAFVEATVNDIEVFERWSFELKGKEAVNHLFELCMGLDSMILGDLQIVSQVKSSVKYASDFGLIDNETKRLMQFVYQCYKAVSTDTDINSGPASIAHAAVLFIKNRFGNLAQKQILMFGLGEIGETTIKNLLENHKIGGLKLINRTYERALNLAQKLDVEAVEIEKLTTEVDQADIVIVATGSQHFTLRLDHINVNQKQEKLFLDLAVPRNIDPNIGEVDGLELIEMDQLNKVQDETLNKRRKNIPKVKTIINLHALEFYDWIKMRELSPLIKSMRTKLENQRLEALEKQKNRFSSSEYEKADLFSKSVVNKMLNQNIEFIKTKYRTDKSIASIFEELYELNQ